jgi:hypothetical protein
MCHKARFSAPCPSFSTLYCIVLYDLTKIINKDNNMVLFADDTSIIVTDTNKLDFNTNNNQTFQDINT